MHGSVNKKLLSLTVIWDLQNLSISTFGLVHKLHVQIWFTVLHELNDMISLLSTSLLHLEDIFWPLGGSNNKL